MDRINAQVALHHRRGLLGDRARQLLSRPPRPGPFHCCYHLLDRFDRGLRRMLLHAEER
mgnify:CR=1 FL=1